MNEKIENLGLDSDKAAFSVQFPPICVEYAILKKVAHDKIPLSTSLRNSNTTLPKEKWRGS
jgi:hypothetical protein